MADETNTTGVQAAAPAVGTTAAPATITPNAAAPLNRAVPEVPLNGSTTPVAPIPAPTAPRPGNVVSEASKRLSQDAGKEEVAKDAPVPEIPTAFDFSKLQPEQLVALKQMLAVTPDRAPTTQQNPTLTLRKFTGLKGDGSEFGGYVVDFKNAFSTYVRDDIANITKEEVMMPVRFLDPKTGKGEVDTKGAPKFTNVVWRDFMNSAQVRCEIIKTRNEPGHIVEGTVLQKETGRWIEREIKTLNTFLTIKLPADAGVSELEIEAKVANA